MAGTPAPRPAFVLLALPLIFSAVVAIGATIGPDTLVEGSPFSINLTNVTDSYSLNTSLTATFPAAPGVFMLNYTGWVYPFSLMGGRVMVNGQNVNQLRLVVRGGEVTRTGRESGTGDISIEIPMDILPAIRYDFLITYEVHNAGDPVRFSLVQQGTKNGTERDALLLPNVSGIGEGDLTVGILADGSLLAAKDIRVQRAVPPPAPLPVNTTAAQTQIPTPTPSVPTPTETTPTETTPTETTPTETTPTETTPSPARPSPPQVTPPPTPAAPPATTAGGPSPFIIGYAAIIVIVTIIADYMLLKE